MRNRQMEPHRDTYPSACANVQFFRNQVKTYLVSTVALTLCVNRKVVVLILEKGGMQIFSLNMKR